MPKSRTSEVLTAKRIERIKPPTSGRVEYWDALLPGFGLRVSQHGSKTWILMTRVDGIAKRVTLGRHPGVTLSKARGLAREALEKAQAGIDPNEEKKAAREAAKTARNAIRNGEWPPGSFGALAETYIKRECAKQRRGKEVESIIRRYLLPAWGNKPLADLKKGDGIELIDSVFIPDRPASAVRLYEVVKRLGNWSVDRDQVDVSPFASLSRKALGIEKQKRQVRLTDDQIRALWPVWNEMDFPFGPLFKLLLLTGVRLRELAEATWSEFDLGKAEWIIPSDRAKMGREQLVPLSPSAVDVLESLPRFSGPYMFSTTGGRRPVSGFSKAKARVDALSGITGWRTHDFRRNVRSGLSELGIPEVVGERILGHVPKGIEAHYNVYEYRTEKRAALNRWAQHVAGIIDPPPENVVKLRDAW